MPLADELSREDVLAGIAVFESDAIDHRFSASEKFDLLSDEGYQYPPKAIAALATRNRTGVLPTPDEFTGGADSKCFTVLRRAGFRVVPKLGLIPFDVGSRYSRKRIGLYLGTTEDTTKGDWTTGYHLHQDDRAGIDGWWFLFPTLGESGRTGHRYGNEWVSETQLRWEGKTGSRRNQPQVESLLSGEFPVLLFWRSNNRDDFTFAGLATPISVRNEVPVSVDWSVSPVERATPRIDDDDASADVNAVNAEEQRERVLRGILARRGQQEFRLRLLGAFGRRCAISGCDIVGVLEAAHIRPYRGASDNHPSNGLLLRADLHTLFDLNLLGIEPGTLTIRVHPSARREPYHRFEGVKLVDAPKLDPTALVYRWQQFLAVDA